MKASIATAFLSLVGCAVAASCSNAQANKIGGYDGYTFGMSFDQALKVRPDARQTKCSFNEVTLCIEYQIAVSEFPATVTVQFSPTHSLLLSKILVTFRSLEEPIAHTCREVGGELMKLLVSKYGDEPFIKNHTATWASSLGGSVSLTALCVSSEKGINVISYNPSGAL